jgi:hypothetical protein
VPVSETKVNPRTLILVAVSFAIVAVLGVTLFVFALPSLTESGTVQIPPQSLRFAAGPAEQRATAIDADGPLLFSDVGGGDRDIYLQHAGTEPLTGWSAFDARFPGTGRDCTLRWDRQARHFTNPCPPGQVVPADGSGLPAYPVQVTDDEQVVVDLSLDNRRAGSVPPGSQPAGSVPTVTAPAG